MPVPTQRTLPSALHQDRDTWGKKDWLPSNCEGGGGGLQEHTGDIL